MLHHSNFRMELFRSSLMLALWLVLSLTAYSNSAESSSLERGMSKLEEHLSKTVPTDDFEANVREAKEKLKDVEKKSQKCISLHRRSNLEFMKALELFISLKDLSDSKRCSKEVLDLIQDLDGAVGRPRVEMSPRNPPRRRVDKIVHAVAKKHFELCYPDAISPKIDELDKDLRRSIMRISKLTSINDGFYEAAKDVIELLRNNRAEMGDFTRRDFEANVIEPCQKLISYLGYENARIVSEMPIYDIDRNQFDKRNAIVNCYKIYGAEELLWEKLLKYIANKHLEVLELYSQIRSEAGIIPPSNSAYSSYTNPGIALMAAMM